LGVDVGAGPSNTLPG
jgi:hypothetical protein